MTKAENFEQSLRSLEEIVQKLEAGELSLEDSLKAFEEGVKLARQCQKTLSEAELKVEKITQEMMREDERSDDV
ncbi:exodeoxyribonuclease VII small subunit [Legionella sp. W05-934-2]|jgi:exodeoxyribonuclease VII small subunit|uniref:exodeoxyribonuclease VII small subunit n=1 Tax=Legionella sp. W05-934-2 TaxID=1198649 RepID=UPI003463364F